MMVPDAAVQLRHVPVMLDMVLAELSPHSGAAYLDGTVGDGGHAAAILAASSPDGTLIGLDRDRQAIDVARQTLAPFAGRFKLLNLNFASPEVPPGPFEGILLDLGVSSRQLDDPVRGFCFREAGPLHMNMDIDSTGTLAELFDRVSEQQLADLIFLYGEERHSRTIAAAIKHAWQMGLIKNTLDLAEVIRRAVRVGWQRIHPATRTFQALRIAVNDELETLMQALPQLADRLAPDGVLAVISYHSGEDRLIKHFLATGRLQAVHKKPLLPTREEIRTNRRARSAKLRVACRRD